jgi:energy-coupling factor transport system permease protein
VEDFELLRNVTFGQFVPQDSTIHHLDPRVKLLGAIFLLVALVVSASLTAMLLSIVVLLGLTALALIPLSYALGALRPVWPFMLILVALQLLFFPGLSESGCETLWQWHFLHITTCSVHLALVSLARFIALMLLINLLTLSTSLNEITHGAEHLLRPLGHIGLPAHELALVLALSLRFVPLLAEETERIMKAQAARGADFGRGRWGFIQRARRLLPLLIPLFITSLDRAEDMAVAMEARCYGGSMGRTYWVQLKSRPTDYIALIIVIFLSAVVLAVP